MDSEDKMFGRIKHFLNSKPLKEIPREGIFGKFDEKKLAEAFKKLKAKLPSNYAEFTPEKLVEIYNTLDEESQKQLREFIAFTYQQKTARDNAPFGDLRYAVYAYSGALLGAKMGADFPGLNNETTKNIYELFGLKVQPSKERQQRTLGWIWYLCTNESP